MMKVITILFVFATFSSSLLAVQGAWRNLAPGRATWTGSGTSWKLVIPLGDAIWHYGPARIWTTPINSDHYEITSRVRPINDRSCGHVFKYKKGSVRTRNLVTKAWGYYISTNYMYISTNGKESAPRINYKFNTNQWYNLKTVVKGALVKIYIDNKLVKQVTMAGAGATSKTDNYVGLWCHGGAQEDGKNFQVKILSGKNKLKCASNDMQIVIPKSSLPFARAKDLRLNDPSCGATEDGKNFYLQTAFDKCGTTTTKTGSTISYSNKVLGRPLVNKAAISRIRDIEIKFSCTYKRKKVLSSLSILPNNTIIKDSILANGKFIFSLKLFPTNQFKNPYTKYPVSLHLRQLVYVEVAVRSVKKELSILAQQCYATPSSSRAIPKHSLIKDSCPADRTLKILNSPTKNVQRFSFETFKFTAGYDKDIYFHCHVIACNGRESNSVCARGCVKKRLGKRGKADVNSFKLVTGPVAVREQEFDEPEPRSSQDDAINLSSILDTDY